MDYTAAQTAGVGAITAIGERGLAIFLAAIVLAGSVFLIRWGFSMAKGALNGNISNVRVSYSGDSMSRAAIRRGRQLNRRDFGHN